MLKSENMVRKSGKNRENYQQNEKSGKLSTKFGKIGTFTYSQY